MDALSFAWAGGLNAGEPHYYRIQGSRLLAEYDNTQRGVNHVHTVWRGPRRRLRDGHPRRPLRPVSPLTTCRLASAGGPPVNR